MKVKLNVTNSIPHTANAGNMRRNQSFKGVMSYIGDANRNFIHYLERGGFFAEFCIMDLCGLVLPRVWQGFNRNKEELGHYNWQAGTEEFLRESITGPSMFLIPIGAVTLAGRLLGKATQIKTDLLDKFSNIFKGTSENIAKANLADSNKAFAGKLFDELFVNAKDRVSNSHKNINDFKENFVNLLTDSVGQKLKRSDLKAKERKFAELVSDINVSFFKKENTYATKLASAGDIFDSARKYMEDVIPSAKLSVDELIAKGKTASTNAVTGIIDKLTDIRKSGRKLLSVGGALSLAGFLYIIPKIYQLSNKNPALAGLEQGKKEDKKC